MRICDNLKSDVNKSHHSRHEDLDEKTVWFDLDLSRFMCTWSARGRRLSPLLELLDRDIRKSVMEVSEFMMVPTCIRL